MMLQAEIAKLRFDLSDQNLQLLPEFEQRVQVLKDLRLIDENQTVLLKGRVACEVSVLKSRLCSILLTGGRSTR